MGTPATYSWLPSSARIVVIDGFGLVPRGTPTAPPPLAWPAKDPGDVLDYVVDLSQAIAGNEGDTIATVDVQIAPANPGDLTLNSASADGDVAILWLSAGIVGTTYAVTVTIGTNAGRLIARTVALPVVSLASGSVPPNAIVDDVGAPLVDQTGAVLTT